MRVCKRVTFDAAHFLPNYTGKCSQLHGHHWVVELAVSGKVDSITGMVTDFSILKGWMQENIIDQFDHHLINDLIPNPTAENIAIWILEAFISTTTEDEPPNLDFIRVWETEDSYAEVSV